MLLTRLKKGGASSLLLYNKLEMEVSNMIPKFRAWVKPGVLSNHPDGVVADAKPDFLGMECLVKRDDLKGKKCFTEIFDFEDIELMQSTGLKDKNGVEIFEGDVVKVSVHNGFDYLDDEVCSVQQSRFHSGLVCINPNNDMEYRIFNQDVLEDYQYEVIGNIYDDKELLEVEG